MLNQNIVFIGFRGSGKKEFAREVARQLKLPFADLDAEIEFTIGMTIEEYSEKYGWQQFREVEQKVAHDFCRNFSGIIASGAITIENSKNLQNLKKTGKFVFLNPPFMQVRKRLMKDPTYPRMNPDLPLAQEIDQMWQQRKDIYGATSDYDVVTDLNGAIEDECAKIISQLPKNFIPRLPSDKRIVVLASDDTDTFAGILDSKTKGRIPNVEIPVLISDKKDSAVITLAKEADIENVEVIDFSDAEEAEQEILDLLREFKPDWVICADWDREFSKKFKDQMGDITLTVHPSLLPQFAELQGEAIHQKVLEYEEKYTGATIHRITSQRETGESVVQRKVLVESDDTTESLAFRVKRQEILGFCEILEKR